MESALTIALKSLSGHPGLLDRGQRCSYQYERYTVLVVKLSGAASK